MTAVATPLHNFNHFNTRRFSEGTVVTAHLVQRVVLTRSHPIRLFTIGFRS
jgi:hypothetical protein